MKKLVCFGLALVLALALAACGAPQPAPSSSAPPASSAASSLPASSTQPQPEPAPAPTSVLTGLELPEDFVAGNRVAAVMVDNYLHARPQRGLGSAQMLFEMVTEGGITRFMALYEDYVNMPVVGPVRSGRDQFTQLAMPLQALMVSMGGSTMNDWMVQTFDLNGRMIDPFYGARATQKDDDRLQRGLGSEYTHFTNGGLLAVEIADLGIDDKRDYGDATYFAFESPDAPRTLPGDGGLSVSIHHSANYRTHFTYDIANEVYLMSQSNAGTGVEREPTVDENTGSQVAFGNVLVLFAEMPAYANLTADVRNVQFGHGGVGYYFNDGRYQQIRWVKDSPLHLPKLMVGDGTGAEITLNAGTTYVAVVDVEHAMDFAFGQPGSEQALG